MSSNHEADDFYRYIESLEGQLHTPGWEDFHDISRMRKWFTENSIKFDQDLGPQYGNVGSPSAHMEKLVADFKPRTRFSSPLTQATFGPLLARVTDVSAFASGAWFRHSEVAERLNFVPRRATWTYLKRLWRFGLLERHTSGAGTLKYKLSKAGATRLRWLGSNES